MRGQKTGELAALSRREGWKNRALGFRGQRFERTGFRRQRFERTEDR
ncbi:MAG: hypothetical protein LBD06_03690 [Candidatus Accumulibacter sp.]|nr:hypothetical protein [Accumulibacter sp.]